MFSNIWQKTGPGPALTGVCQSSCTKRPDVTSLTGNQLTTGLYIESVHQKGKNLNRLLVACIGAPL